MDQIEKLGDLEESRYFAGHKTDESGSINEKFINGYSFRKSVNSSLTCLVFLISTAAIDLM
jgi:hypothetical protein